MKSKLLNRIATANTQRYEDPNEVDGYLSEPYHAIRASLALNLLIKEMNKTFTPNAYSKLNVLELASSTGTVAKIIEERNTYNVIASDVEYLPLHLAHHKGLKCVQLDATTELPFVSRSFHGIYMGELIEHIFDTTLILSECNRILVDKGILVITTPNLAGLQDRIAFIFGKAPRHVNPLHEYLRLHIRPFTFDLLRKVLEATSFKITNVQSNLVRFRFSSGKSLNSRLLAKLFPTFGGSLIVSAQKKNDNL